MSALVTVATDWGRVPTEWGPLVCIKRRHHAQLRVGREWTYGRGMLRTNVLGTFTRSRLIRTLDFTLVRYQTLWENRNIHQHDIGEQKLRTSTAHTFNGGTPSKLKRIRRKGHRIGTMDTVVSNLATRRDKPRRNSTVGCRVLHRIPSKVWNKGTTPTRWPFLPLPPQAVQP